MGLREQRRRETERRIREVAYRLFADRGFDGTTVEMIADEAEVSPRTFFRYFETKDGVLAVLGFDLVDDVLEQVGPDPSVTELIRRIAVSIEARLEEESFHRAVVLCRQNPNLRDQIATWRDRWALRLAEGLAAANDTGVPTLAQRVVSSAALHTIGVCADEWLSRRPDAAFTALADDAARSLAAGARPPDA